MAKSSEDSISYLVDDEVIDFIANKEGELITRTELKQLVESALKEKGVIKENRQIDNYLIRLKNERRTKFTHFLHSEGRGLYKSLPRNEENLNTFDLVDLDSDIEKLHAELDKKLEEALLVCFRSGKDVSDIVDFKKDIDSSKNTLMNIVKQLHNLKN